MIDQSPLISFDQLKSVTGCKTRESLETNLRGNKVRFLYGADGKPFTTVYAIHAAMGLIPAQTETKDIEFRR